MTYFTKLSSDPITLEEGMDLIPKYNYSMGRTFLPYRGLIVWNILPKSYKLSDSHSSFKKKIKKKKDQALLDELSFEKESCLITNNDDDFCYL